MSGSSEELRKRAREFAPRRVMRLLDAPALSVLIAVMDMKRSNWPMGWTAERIGLITISGIEPWLSDLPATTGDTDLERLQSVYSQIADQKPTEWLRQMANNAVCQASIVSRILGPSLHLIGGGGNCSVAVTEALIWLESGAADAVLVIAFDRTRSGDSGAERGDAVGITLANDADRSAAVADVDLAAMATGGTVIEAMCTLTSTVASAPASKTSSS